MISCNAETKVNFIVDNNLYAVASISDTEIKDMPEPPQKIDYYFDGWYIDDGEFNIPLTASSTEENSINGICNAYAKWTSMENPLKAVVFKDIVFTYDGNAKTIDILNLPEGAHVLYSSSPSYINAGIYIIRATITLDGYQSISKDAKLTINKATYDMSQIEFNDNSFDFDGKAHKITISGDLPIGVIVSYTGNGKSAVGTHKVTASFTGDNKNYKDIPSMEASYTINHANSDIPEEDLSGLVLIANGIAKFNVVYTNEAGAKNVKAANDFIESLREKGASVSNIVSDSDISSISDCEIIIGTNVRSRTEECCVLAKDLGPEGFVIKVVENRIIIAGGNDDMTAYALSYFIENVVNLKGTSGFITALSVASDYCYEKITEFNIDSITLSGFDIADYTLLIDIDAIEDYNMGVIENFQQGLFNVSGYFLDMGFLENTDAYDHKFIIRYAADAGEAGFRAYSDNGDFIIECSYANAFEGAFHEFVSKFFYEREGVIELDSDFKYISNVSIVYYSDFGAVGDGKADDFSAILRTHTYANECGQRVFGDQGATYYIYPDSFTQSIPIKTNVNWNGASFIINDLGSSAYANRTLALFTIEREYDELSYGASAIQKNFGKIKVYEGDTELPWLSEVLEAKSLIRLINSNKKDYIRYGKNESDGAKRTEMFIVEKDGTITDKTEVRFDFDTVTNLYIWRVDDSPITLENGTFYNICNRTVAETEYKIEYHAYNRGFKIQRANVVIQDIVHKVLEEPDLDISVNETFGSGMESYPYNAGFFYIDRTYNLLIKDSVISGHTTYFQIKKSTSTAESTTGYNYV